MRVCIHSGCACLCVRSCMYTFGLRVLVCERDGEHTEGGGGGGDHCYSRTRSPRWWRRGKAVDTRNIPDMLYRPQEAAVHNANVVVCVCE